jgi:ADP-ribose pyrophosphatase YjhB (NUDIX family)
LRNFCRDISPKNPNRISLPTPSWGNHRGCTRPKAYVVPENNELLLVREKMDNKWSLPGGYADLGMTPSQIAINEVKEESGYDVEPVRILGFIDYNKHQERQFPFDIYQLFMECKIVGGDPKPGIETSEVGFFDIEYLPELSTRRVTKDQIVTMFELCQNSELAPIFD